MSEPNQDLELKGCWIRPRSYVTYLEECDVTLELKNVSDGLIEIEKISCSFTTDDGLLPTEYFISAMMSIKPNNISRMRIEFIADLTLQWGTNYATINVTYRKDKTSIQSVTFANPYTRCIIINPIHPAEKHFFISHKDPEDTDLATKLNLHLTKIGFTGYVAENDRKPGTDIWSEKIFPSINDCVALIVLWTSAAAADAATIFREVEYARQRQKRVILLAEHGLEIPQIFQGDKEYVQLKGKITADELVSLVANIEKTYTAGGFESS